jgi:hypothetical protein
VVTVEDQERVGLLLAVVFFGPGDRFGLAVIGALIGMVHSIACVTLGLSQITGAGLCNGLHKMNFFRPDVMPLASCSWVLMRMVHNIVL